MAQHGLIIAGLSSSSGKTLTTLGLLKALTQKNISISAAKTGPDYIDPGFHRAVLGEDSVNLDGFAMSPDLLRHLAQQQSGETLIIEGVMGLFDGGAGSATSLAHHLGLPIILVMDCRGQSETTAEIAAGLRSRLHDQGLTLAGVILNRLSTARHGQGIVDHCQKLGIKVLGQVPHHPDIEMPSRHLGLVQAFDLAAEGQLNALIDHAGKMMTDGLDLEAILAAAKPITAPEQTAEALPPPGQKIAVAYDAAFGFAYPHLLKGWQRQGAEVSVFSPLNDDAPKDDADFIFLPGGYPELHLDQITTAEHFKKGMLRSAEKGIPIYGECGGYMVLGHGIIDGQGRHVPMLGLLDLETSFAAPKRVLGYRHLRQINNAMPYWPEVILGHEFHFTAATKTADTKGQALFTTQDKSGKDLGDMGLVQGNIAGSYAHIIAGLKR